MLCARDAVPVIQVSGVCVPVTESLVFVCP